jgi:spermidine synthase
MRRFLPIGRDRGAAFALGFAALSAQMLFFRELVAAFHGNEFTLGAWFAVWLFWTAAGSGWPAGNPRLPDGAAPPPRPPALQPALLGLAALIPLTDLGIRCIRLLLRAAPGETIGFAPAVAAASVLLAPFGLLSGVGFARLCRPAAPGHGEKISLPVLVAFEAAGSAAGGLFCSLFLFRAFPPLASAVLLAVVTAGASFAIRDPVRAAARGAGGLLRIAGWTAAAAVLLTVPALRLQRVLDRALWTVGDLLETRSTAYGLLAAARLGSQVTFYESGIPLFSAPDPESAEDNVHPALLQIPAPRSVLLLGGGPGGSVLECLKHPSVTAVHVVELDPGILAAARACLPEPGRSVFSDPRVTFHLDDGRRFLERTDSRFDAILMNFPEPFTVQLNRFYTVEFYRLAADRLNPGGVLSFSLPSSENAVGGELLDMLSATRSGLAAVFRGVVLLPGDRCRFIASMDTANLTADPSVLSGRIRERGLDSRLLYIRPYFIDAQWCAERRENLRGRLRDVPPGEWNRDFRPLGYWRSLVLWSGRYAPALRRPLEGLSSIANRTGLAGLAAAFAVISAAVLLLTRKRREPRAVLLAVWTAGASGLSLELTVLFAYQTLFGALAGDMALLAAGSMAGLGLGAASAALSGSGRAPRLDRALAAVAGAALATAAAVSALKSCTPSVSALPCFTLLNAASGFFCGRVFGAAGRTDPLDFLTRRNPAAVLYAVDLAGSMAGALAAASLAIPLLGVIGTFGLVAAWNGVAAAACRPPRLRS